MVDSGIFPSESIDVLVLELCVFLKLIIIMDSPVMILVKE